MAVECDNIFLWGSYSFATDITHIINYEKHYFAYLYIMNHTKKIFFMFEIYRWDLLIDIEIRYAHN